MKRLSALGIAPIILLAVLAAYGQNARKKPAGKAPDGANNGQAPAASKAKADDVSAFMQLKLRHSQKVLEGVVMEDFEMIAANAQQLALLTQDENWQVLQTPAYRRYSDEFARIAGRLKDAAEDENVDGAALDYVQLTLTCVNCHKHVRDVRRNGQ